MSEPIVRGRVWKFGDDINTDLMLPAELSWLPEEQQKRAVFAANRPGWVDEVRSGDIIVAGDNFGTGSGRPAPRSLRNLGIVCLIANSINGLFFRNCVNFGLLAVECPGVAAAFDEGQIAELSLAGFTVRNPASGVTLAGAPIPERLLTLMRAGGLLPDLERQGLIEPLPTVSAAS